MTQILQATASGEQHGLINTLTNSVPFDDFKHCTPAVKAKLEKQKKYDAEIKKVEYLNSKGRHERLTKPYCKYAGDPIQIYHLIPGRKYELPMGLINEVNESNSKIIKRSGLMEIDGKPVNQDNSPLNQDQEGDWIHKLVPCF